MAKSQGMSTKRRKALLSPSHQDKKRIEQERGKEKERPGGGKNSGEGQDRENRGLFIQLNF